MYGLGMPIADYEETSGSLSSPPEILCEGTRQLFERIDMTMTKCGFLRGIASQNSIQFVLFAENDRGADCAARLRLNQYGSLAKVKGCVRVTDRSSICRDPSGYALSGSNSDTEQRLVVLASTSKNTH